MSNSSDFHATQAAFNFLERYRFQESKKAKTIETFLKIRFSGQLVWIAPNNEKEWNFYFYQGRIIYATGGTHSVRRWARTLAAYCPQIQFDITQRQDDLCKIEPDPFINCWEYQLLCLWREQQKITQDQIEKFIQSVLEEVLFDLSKHDGLTHQIKAARSLFKPIALIDEKQAIAGVQQLWQAVWQAKTTSYSLDEAPIIRQREQLQKQTPAKIYQVLTYLLTGENTLRDLAVKMKRDVVQVTRLLLPYLQSGLVELISIPDLPAPVCPRVPNQPSEPTNSTKPLIACVDDSVSVCQTLEKLITAAGYRFIGINDGLRALTSLLACKPDLIFLDLMMPYTNGYEICSKLRKAPSFRNTPIVILTGNDGIVDQVRSRLIGATDFLSKPVDAGRVLSTISKHLAPSSLAQEGVQVKESKTVDASFGLP